MKRVNLTKYGFIRWAEEDFSDDGNRFQCYRVNEVGRLRISKLVSDGQVCLSASMTDGKLPYEIYSVLPHYKDSEWKLNGVSLESLSDQNLDDFYESCRLYEREYIESEENLVYPSLSDITKVCKKLWSFRKSELDELDRLISKYVIKLAANLKAHEWANIQTSLNHISLDLQSFDPKVYPQKIQNSVYSFSFVSSSHDKHSYWYTSVMELIDKVR